MHYKNLPEAQISEFILPSPSNNIQKLNLHINIILQSPLVLVKRHIPSSSRGTPSKLTGKGRAALYAVVNESFSCIKVYMIITHRREPVPRIFESSALSNADADRLVDSGDE